MDEWKRQVNIELLRLCNKTLKDFSLTEEQVASAWSNQYEPQEFVESLINE